MKPIDNEESNGIFSLVAGILGLILMINILSIYPNFPPLILGVLALITGRKPKKNGYKYGTYGYYLGIIVTVIGATQTIAWIIYVYVSSLML